MEVDFSSSRCSGHHRLYPGTALLLYEGASLLHLGLAMDFLWWDCRLLGPRIWGLPPCSRWLIALILLSSFLRSFSVLPGATFFFLGVSPAGRAIMLRTEPEVSAIRFPSLTRFFSFSLLIPAGTGSFIASGAHCCEFFPLYLYRSDLTLFPSRIYGGPAPGKLRCTSSEKSSSLHYGIFQ